MAELPILPLRPAALLADTVHMSAEQLGVYCRILCSLWINGGKLPDLDDELARIGGISRAKWKKISPQIRRLLISADGFVSQKRLTATWLEVQELRRKRALAGRARWARNKPG